MKPKITYRPGDSYIHHLHPLVKLAWLLLGTVLVFVRRDPWVILAVLTLISGAFYLAKFPPHRVGGTRLFTSAALLLGLFQILFVRSGTVWLQLGLLQVTSDGVAAAVYIAGRFLSVVLLSYLFVLTTDPNDFAYALMQVGLPYRYGFALITALRLVPVFEQEGHIVYQAQLARGVRYDMKSPRRFFILGRQFFLPMLVSALSKVDTLAVSMEGRCFGKYPTRTFLRVVRFTRRDILALLVLGASVVGLSLS